VGERLGSEVVGDGVGIEVGAKAVIVDVKYA